MIQRVQTIYLLLAVIVLCMIFFLSLGSFAEGGSRYTIYMTGIYDGENTLVQDSFLFYASAGIAALTGILLFVAIFLYNKRPLQMKLVSVGQFLELLLLVLVILLISPPFEGIGNEVAVDYGTGTFLPAVAFALSWLGRRGIKKDEELVRSVDRLR